MKVIYPPTKFNRKAEDYPDFKIFLAGTIDMGNSENWQAKIINFFKEYPITFLNPRRPDWDNNIEQSLKDSRFVEQVTWELSNLVKADLIIMYLAAGSESRISLLELGAFHNKNIIVFCPEGFNRKGNIDVFCDFFQITIFEEYDKFINYVQKTLNKKLFKA